MNPPSPAEFAHMNRADRLAALRQAQNCFGIAASEYRKLAMIHTHMVRNSSGQFGDER